MASVANNDHFWRLDDSEIKIGDKGLIWESGFVITDC